MIKALIFTAVSVLSLAATANAAAADSKGAKKTQDGAVSASQPAPAASTDKKYCVKDTLTGSRVSHTVCKTLREWKAEGFDPLNS